MEKKPHQAERSPDPKATKAKVRQPTPDTFPTDYQLEENDLESIGRSSRFFDKPAPTPKKLNEESMKGILNSEEASNCSDLKPRKDDPAQPGYKQLIKTEFFSKKPSSSEIIVEDSSSTSQQSDNSSVLSNVNLSSSNFPAVPADLPKKAQSRHPSQTSDSKAAQETSSATPTSPAHIPSEMDSTAAKFQPKFGSETLDGTKTSSEPPKEPHLNSPKPQIFYSNPSSSNIDRGSTANPSHKNDPWRHSPTLGIQKNYSVHVFDQPDSTTQEPKPSSKKAPEPSPKEPTNLKADLPKPSQEQPESPTPSSEAQDITQPLKIPKVSASETPPLTSDPEISKTVKKSPENLQQPLSEAEDSDSPEDLHQPSSGEGDSYSPVRFNSGSHTSEAPSELSSTTSESFLRNRKPTPSEDVKLQASINIEKPMVVEENSQGAKESQAEDRNSGNPASQEGGAGERSSQPVAGIPGENPLEFSHQIDAERSFKKPTEAKEEKPFETIPGPVEKASPEVSKPAGEIPLEKIIKKDQKSGELKAEPIDDKESASEKKPNEIVREKAAPEPEGNPKPDIQRAQSDPGNDPRRSVPESASKRSIDVKNPKELAKICSEILLLFGAAKDFSLRSKGDGLEIENENHKFLFAPSVVRDFLGLYSILLEDKAEATDVPAFKDEEGLIQTKKEDIMKLLEPESPSPSQEVPFSKDFHAFLRGLYQVPMLTFSSNSNAIFELLNCLHHCSALSEALAPELFKSEELGRRFSCLQSALLPIAKEVWQKKGRFEPKELYSLLYKIDLERLGRELKERSGEVSKLKSEIVRLSAEKEQLEARNSKSLITKEQANELKDMLKNSQENSRLLEERNNSILANKMVDDQWAKFDQVLIAKLGETSTLLQKEKDRVEELEREVSEIKSRLEKQEKVIEDLDGANSALEKKNLELTESIVSRRMVDLARSKMGPSLTVESPASNCSGSSKDLKDSQIDEEKNSFIQNNLSLLSEKDDAKEARERIEVIYEEEENEEQDDQERIHDNEVAEGKEAKAKEVRDEKEVKDDSEVKDDRDFPSEFEVDNKKVKSRGDSEEIQGNSSEDRKSVNLSRGSRPEEAHSAHSINENQAGFFPLDAGSRPDSVPADGRLVSKRLDELQLLILHHNGLLDKIERSKSELKQMVSSEENSFKRTLELQDKEILDLKAQLLIASNSEGKLIPSKRKKGTPIWPFVLAIVLLSHLIRSLY